MGAAPIERTSCSMDTSSHDRALPPAPPRARRGARAEADIVSRVYRDRYTHLEARRRSPAMGAPPCAPDSAHGDGRRAFTVPRRRKARAGRELRHPRADTVPSSPKRAPRAARFGAFRSSSQRPAPRAASTRRVDDGAPSSPAAPRGQRPSALLWLGRRHHRATRDSLRAPLRELINGARRQEQPRQRLLLFLLFCGRRFRSCRL